MSTRHDRNYRSWDGGGDDPPHTDVVLDPLSDPATDEFGRRLWLRGTWQDTAKFYRRLSEVFARITVVNGGTEDGVDISSEDHDCLFADFDVTTGEARHLTLKGGSTGNVLRDWIYRGRPPLLDAEFGVWSSSSTARSKNNLCLRHHHEDGEPIRYAYVLGSRPIWQASYVTHVWWWSVCLTAHFCAKYFWHKILGFKDD